MDLQSPETFVSLFLEIRKKTQSGHLILGGAGIKLSNVAVSVVTPSSLQLKVAEHVQNIELPEGVRIVPSSCQKLQHFAADNLCLRFQVHTENNAEFSPTVLESMRAQKRYTFYCQSCKEVIISQWEFIRVLPLPSGGWNDVVGEWCCHPDPFAGRKLLPRENDCLLGDTFLLVESGSFCDSVIWEPRTDLKKDKSLPTDVIGSISKGKENTTIFCKHCKSILGEAASQETAKLYITELIILPAFEEISKIELDHRSQFVESFVARRLAELSDAKSIFRFSLEGLEGTVFALLWLLNSDTLLVGCFRNLTCDSISNVAGENTLNSSQQTSYEARSAVKVLYQPCVQNENGNVINIWENDIGVHSLTLPTQTCSEVLQILSSSTLSLPSSLRSMNSFQVAFLRL
ncbi:E3 ubiquitin-protein ligase E3D [Protopterus annectens]|uniref:E3 ubiquitin-protein ligase E3D n=1 Tax=Protopterus annectens TaxID=7888 RepID=UPI001CF99109|nr:E3 ubiquitin-protein ligase E3D [Protopterus annectens]